MYLQLMFLFDDMEVKSYRTGFTMFTRMLYATLTFYLESSNATFQGFSFWCFEFGNLGFLL